MATPSIGRQTAQRPPRAGTMFVTLTLIAINVAVFGLMALRGVSVLEPTINDLLKWGADYGPLTTHGQWWRLVTCMFLHIGIIHLLMNMFVLLNIGAFMERVFGYAGFTVVYMLAGLGGSLLSLAWHPYTVSAGASGAIFGLYGALLAFLLIQRNALPKETLKSLSQGAIVFVGYNLLYGVTKSGIDMGAHLGGLAAGFCAGCVLALPGSRVRKNLAVTVAGLAIVFLCGFAMPPAEDLSGQMEHFEATETRLIDVYNSSLEKWKSNQLTNQQFAQTVEDKIVAPWKAEGEAFSKFKRLPPKQEHLVSLLLEYISDRQEAWTLVAQGARTNDESLVKKANDKDAEAAAVSAKIALEK